MDIVLPNRLYANCPANDGIRSILVSTTASSPSVEVSKSVNLLLIVSPSDSLKTFATSV
jgi:hypothetical protein